MTDKVSANDTPMTRALHWALAREATDPKVAALLADARRDCRHVAPLLGLNVQQFRAVQAMMNTTTEG